MPILHTKDGKAFVSAGGALVEADCDCISGAVPKCACGAAALGLATEYKTTCCNQGGVGYNHFSWNVSGSLAGSDCCTDCCKIAGVPASTSGGYVNIHGYLGDVAPGGGSNALSGATWTMLADGWDNCRETANHTVYPYWFEPPSACEAALGDVFQFCTDGRPAMTGNGGVLYYGGFRGTGSYLALGMPLPSDTPFFRAVGPVVATIKFSQGTNCNAGQDESQYTIGASHRFRFDFTAPAQLKLAVAMHAETKKRTAWGVVTETNNANLDVPPGTTKYLVVDGGFHWAGDYFQLTITTEAA